MSHETQTRTKRKRISTGTRTQVVSQLVSSQVLYQLSYRDPVLIHSLIERVHVCFNLTTGDFAQRRLIPFDLESSRIFLCWSVPLVK